MSETWQEYAMNLPKEALIVSIELLNEETGELNGEIDELRAALAERDAKLAALEEDVVTEEMKMAVRWAPSSAYWSTVLVNHFGQDARDGINSLEKQLREQIAAAGAAPASIHDTDRLAYLYGGRKTTSRMLIDLELKLLADTPVTLSEAREAIDHAIANPAPKEPT